MSECFDLCPGLVPRIARHNSRCENGWLISFYSWHRGLSVCVSAQARGSAHRVLASDQPQPGPETHGELILARPGSSHGSRDPRDPDRGGRASVRVYCAARVTRPGPGHPR